MPRYGRGRYAGHERGYQPHLAGKYEINPRVWNSQEIERSLFADIHVRLTRIQRYIMQMDNMIPQARNPRIKFVLDPNGEEVVPLTLRHFVKNVLTTMYALDVAVTLCAKYVESLRLKPGSAQAIVGQSTVLDALVDGPGRRKKITDFVNLIETYLKNTPLLSWPNEDSIVNTTVYQLSRGAFHELNVYIRNVWTQANGNMYNYDKSDRAAPHLNAIESIGGDMWQLDHTVFRSEEHYNLPFFVDSPYNFKKFSDMSPSMPAKLMSGLKYGSQYGPFKWDVYGHPDDLYRESGGVGYDRGIDQMEEAGMLGSFSKLRIEADDTRAQTADA